MLAAVLIVMIGYAFLGFKLRKSPFIWAIAGFSMVLLVLLFAGPAVLLFKDPSAGLVYWTVLNIISITLAIIVAAVIMFKNKNLLFKAKSVSA